MEAPSNLNTDGKVPLAFLPEIDQSRILDHLYSAKHAGKPLCGKNDRASLLITDKLCALS
jgi:hypothetical protein